MSSSAGRASCACSPEDKVRRLLQRTTCRARARCSRAAPPAQPAHPFPDTTSTSPSAASKTCQGGQGACEQERPRSWCLERRHEDLRARTRLAHSVSQSVCSTEISSRSTGECAQRMRQPYTARQTDGNVDARHVITEVDVRTSTIARSSRRMERQTCLFVYWNENGLHQM